jgi:2-dehydropantoate 2-reductase
MRIVVIGAGALGSLYAAYLTRGGHDVALIARGVRAQGLTKHGIVVTGVEEFSAFCEIVTEPERLRSADLLILATKTYDTPSTLHSLRALKVASAYSVQNGVLKNDLIAATFGPDAAVGAISMLGAQVLAAQGDEPGAVRYTMRGATTVGEIAGGESSRVDRLVEMLSSAGLNANASNNIMSVEWSKFVSWSAVSALAVLTRQPTWRFLSDPDTALIAARIMRETAAVAERLNVPLIDTRLTSAALNHRSEADAVELIRAFGAQLQADSPELRQSMLQDADRRRRLEVEETLAYTLTLAARLALPAPTLDLCCRVLRMVSRAARCGSDAPGGAGGKAE